LHCQSDQIVKRGKTARGTQRALCQHTLCATGSFLLDYCSRGCLPEAKHTIIDMRLNASGVRDTANLAKTSLPSVGTEDDRLCPCPRRGFDKSYAPRHAMV
ncbi:MAG TPA: hypothetical protein VLQ80_00645, partial [Candidatus Saccharimonadia bacterium]|nr:hypothetical protein [Candidatus Saccharimonadia bacterium]